MTLICKFKNVIIVLFLFYSGAVYCLLPDCYLGGWLLPGCYATLSQHIHPIL